MAATFTTLMLDCTDCVKVATFWAAAMGWELDEVDDRGGFLIDPSGRSDGMHVQPVPEPKTAKNRLHFDLRPTGTMQEEVDRLLALGATVRGFIEVDDSFWTQMRDPEGNEFCVLRGPDDGWDGDPHS